MSGPDPRAKDLTELHTHYQSGKLRILVGNGPSIGVGFPTWEKLNLGLLRRLVESDASSQMLWASVVASKLPELTAAVYDVLGRDGAAEFVKAAKPTEFWRNLSTVLYSGMNRDALRPSDVHFQLAAMSKRASIATTNFDPLIEIAMAELGARKIDWRVYRSTPGKPGASRREVVEHVHGWIDQDGKRGGNLVLTEADYFELARNSSNPANKRLRMLFTQPGAALIIGMSMADINIRRLLYVLSKKPLGQNSTVYIVLKQRDPLVDSYTREYWDERRIRLVFYREHQELPGLLRDIQWGTPQAGKNPAWTEDSVQSRTGHLPDQSIFDDDWQELAHSTLEALKLRISRMFALPAAEICELALFVPIASARNTRLFLIANSRRQRGGKEARSFGASRTLAFCSDGEQGLAGIAFSRGLERESLFGDKGLDFNFTETMKQQWVNEEGYRDWRSALAIPVLDGPHWLPRSVVTITSNMSKPFWARFEENALFRQELLLWVKTNASWLLGGFLND